MLNDVIYPAIVNEGVYPPSEDTYALLDSIQTFKDDVMLDMGCGSGYISLNCANRIDTLFAVDVQYCAVSNTRENLSKHGMLSKSHVLQSDLFGAISSSYKFTLIAFNPPYLPGDEFHTTMDPALIGGNTGVEVSERFIIQCVEHLHESGRVYLVTSSLSDIQYLERVMKSNGLQPSIVSEEPLFFEKLVVLKGTREK